MICSSVNRPRRVQFLLATRNKGKILEIQEVLRGLDVEFRYLPDVEDLREAEESGLTFAENARLKAQHYYRLTGITSLADDSGLMVDALEEAPGIHSARFAPSDAERVEKLLNALKGVEAPDRSARFVCAICLWMGRSSIEVQAMVEGEILQSPKGAGGFGYDPIFHYPPLGNTFAELSLEEKNQVSHRARALEKLRVALGAAGISETSARLRRKRTLGG